MARSSRSGDLGKLLRQVFEMKEGFVFKESQLPGHPEEWRARGFVLGHYLKNGDPLAREKVVITPLICGVEMYPATYLFEGGKVVEIRYEKGFDFEKYFPGYGGSLSKARESGNTLDYIAFAKEIEEIVRHSATE